MTSRFVPSCAFVAFAFAAILDSRAFAADTAVAKHGASARLAQVPDFSRAGYQGGAAPIPNVPVAANAKDFGAVGDGEHDDTAAIQAAINATNRGAILLPAGRYKVTDFIRITKPGIVLRGAGSTATTLWFPRGLDELHPREMKESRGLPTSGYSFDGAFLTVQGSYRAAPLARFAQNAKRGDRDAVLDTTRKLKVGQVVLVHLQEAADHSLKKHLYNNDPGDLSHAKPLDTKMLVRVTAIAGARVTFDRPLRFDTRPEWQPELRAFEPTVSEVGIEGIGFQFPNAKYRGHFNENGANAIELREVSNCWVRDVLIHNGDLGLNIVACQNTIDGVVFTADAARETKESAVPDCTGHHAIQCKSAEDNLITHFELRTCYVHDLTVEHASGNVFADGRGRDLCLDHHKDTPYENLFTDLDCGRGTRVWLCGGGQGLGRQSAGYGTFWNLRAAKPIAAPPPGWGPKTLTLVGLSPESAEPRNLYTAQITRGR